MNTFLFFINDIIEYACFYPRLPNLIGYMNKCLSFIILTLCPKYQLTSHQ